MASGSDGIAGIFRHVGRSSRESTANRIGKMLSKSFVYMSVHLSQVTNSTGVCDK